MKEDKKIKEIFGCDYIVGKGNLYPLQKWYNKLIDKKIEEIDVYDILRMIRQNEFIDIAIIRAIDYLKENPFIGDIYDGELLEKLSNIDISYLTKHLDEIKDILNNALNESKNYLWICSDEKEEYEGIINKFNEKILDFNN